MTNDRGIGSWIERQARIAADRPALVYGETFRTYGELAHRIRRLAHGFRELGVRRRDRVGWLGANHPAFLEVFFATAKLGAVLAPVNHQLDSAVIGKILEDFAPAVVVEGATRGVPRTPNVRSHVIVDAATDADVDYEHLIANSSDAPLDETIGLDDLSMLPYTSGTTGTPKGVMLTHGNLTWNVINLLSVVDFQRHDVTIAIAPFFRTGGTGVNVLPVLFKGGTVIVPEAPDAEEILRLIELQRVTIGFGNPDLLELLTASPRWLVADLSSIRLFITGGAPVPEHLIHTYADRGVTFLQGYGLSEAAPVVLLLDAESAPSKVGSAGRPAMFVDVRVVRTDGMNCEANEAGELLVRGPNVMAGYWQHADATRAAIDEDGWLRTGDAARIDEDGFVWIVDRVNDAYEVSGHIVYPGDVERVLRQHPGVVDAAVAENERSGVAYVVLGAGSEADDEELMQFCREHLAMHEVPSAIVFVERLPRNSVGKLLRHELSR